MCISLLFIKLFFINVINVLAYSKDLLSFIANKTIINKMSSSSFSKNLVEEKFSSSVKTLRVNFFFPFIYSYLAIPIWDGGKSSLKVPECKWYKNVVFPTPLPPIIYILFCSSTLIDGETLKL